MNNHEDVDQRAHRADFDALAEGVVWQDAEGRILDANEAAAPILGLTRDELLGRTSKDPRWYAVREDGTPLKAEDHPGIVALRTGEPQRGRIMGIIAPNIGRRWISIHAMPRFSEGSPKPIGVVASFVDVTAHVEARQRLQEQTRELADLYDQAPCGYHMLDAQGLYVRINDTALDWLGLTREQVIGRRSPRDFMTEESRQLFAANFPRVMAGLPLDGLELEMISAGGHRRWVRVTARPVIDPQGRFVATRSTLNDTTESRAARVALEQLSAQQQLLLDNDLVGIVRIKDRRFVWKNRAFGRIFGYGPGELLGHETSILFPDRASFDAFGKAWASELADGGSYRATIELRRKDGSAVWADCSGATLDPATGESMWFSKDVTAQRRAEALRVEAADLAAANRQLQETARLHSLFLSNMSHELRTPLNAVVGFTGILRKTSDSLDIAKRSKYLDQIQSSARHLLSMIESMLDLARLEGGQVPLQPTPFDPAMAVREVVDMLEAVARQREVVLATEFPGPLALVCLDPLRLKQVLLNYLSNAIKFSRHRGCVVARAMMPAPDRLRIEVEDDGIGISDQDQARLFVRFQQLSSGATKAYQGTGIGLALVKQIVKSQGGQVGIRSAIGQGSMFWAELPCPAAAGPDVHEKVPPSGR